MNDGNTLNIGDLAEPVTALINHVAEFTGGALRPRQMKRIAAAEREIERDKALHDIEIKKINFFGDQQLSELQQRAMTRHLNDETRNQQNIEDIVYKSLPELNEDAKPEEIDRDWLSIFFDKSKKFSDSEMQILWAKILAGEANHVGSFSKRTIELVSTFDKNDAHLFTKLCSFGWDIDGIRVLILEGDVFTTEIYTKNDINFDNLTHLETIGLIKFVDGMGYYNIDVPPKLDASYFDNQVNLEFKKEEYNKLEVGRVLLTKSGEELAPICGAEEIEGFLEFVLDKWNANYKYNDAPKATVIK